MDESSAILLNTLPRCRIFFVADRTSRATGTVVDVFPVGGLGGGVVEWNSRLNVNPSHGLDGLPNYLSGLQLPKLHKT
jgi:hypothetical protein